MCLSSHVQLYLACNSGKEKNQRKNCFESNLRGIPSSANREKNLKVFRVPQRRNILLKTEVFPSFPPLAKHQFPALHGLLIPPNAAMVRVSRTALY